MNCEAFQENMMAFLDGELPPETRAAFESHLSVCDTCAGEFSAFSELQEELKMMTFKEPSEAELERYWGSIYNRIERGTGWVLFSVGSILLLCYGAFKLIEEMVRNPDVALALKTGTLALIFGLVVLLVSVLRERLAVRKVDKYSREVKK